MKGLFFATILCLFVSHAYAASAVPKELVGIWATEAAEFRGEVLWKGQAIYLDDDGVAGFVGGDGMDVMGVRAIMRSYDPKTHILSFDFTEYGKVVLSGQTCVYDPAQKVLFSEKNPRELYRRRFEAVSSEMRRSLGLEVKVK
jgi:hypothetical protein